MNAVSENMYSVLAKLCGGEGDGCLAINSLTTVEYPDMLAATPKLLLTLESLREGNGYVADEVANFPVNLRCRDTCMLSI